ncbi:MAG: hypothetical protein KA205_06120 [Acidobacteria bacterium]|jgi:hypothetical protein|nr:hypothetical protein [Acidobacteriota bacterium]
MKRVVAVVGAVAMMLVAASAFAQAKPNFSGKWAMDAEKTTAANPNMGGGGGGGRMGGGAGGGATTITMDAATLTIERETPNGASKLVYKLDGSESKNMVNGRGGQTEQVSKATIDGAKVVIKTAGANGEQVSSWYMDGDWLVSERTTQNGAQKTYYKKG